MIVHKNKINTGPFCAALQPGDGVTGLWARVTCPKCKAKRPTETERMRAYLRKKKIAKGLDV